jgi:methionyl-tRNA synthetase
VQLFTKNWLEAGLKDRAITRDMSWGVPVPLPNREGKVIYVWFEAVIGYLSASKEWAALGADPDEWKEYWTDPNTQSYYFLGKDNIPFHTIIWPSILMGYGGLNLPYDVPANEILTFKGEAFSKSRGVGVDVPSLVTRFDADVIRYYLASNMPENRDTDFSLDDLEAKVYNELVATLGNFYHWVLIFTFKNFGQVPPTCQSCPPEIEAQLKDATAMPAGRSSVSSYETRATDEALARSKLSVEALECPKCGKILEPNMENCPTCGEFVRKLEPEGAVTAAAESPTTNISG